MGAPVIVLDTNVLVSAFAWGGIPLKILQLVSEKHFSLVISHLQLNEFRRVAAYAKIDLSIERQEEALVTLENLAQVSDIMPFTNRIKDDPSDNILLDTAHVCGASYIISGDKHLLRLKTHGRTHILTPIEFLDLHSEETARRFTKS